MTLDEIDAVSGAGFWSDLWESISGAFTASADFLGFDGHFGYQGGGGGSLSLGGFFGAVSGLTGLGFLLPEGVSIGLGHEDGVESEARRDAEALFGLVISLPAQGAAAGAGAEAAGTQYAHSSVDAADFFGQFMASGIHNLSEAAIQGYPLSSGIPSGEIRLSDPHYSLTNPAIGGGE